MANTAGASGRAPALPPLDPANTAGALPDTDGGLRARVRFVLGELKGAIVSQRAFLVKCGDRRPSWKAGAYADAVRLLEAALEGGERWERVAMRPAKPRTSQ